jgi:hypothetical protein
MLISKSIGGEPTEPKHFWNIFERGIDPHVDDPDHCHVWNAFFRSIPFMSNHASCFQNHSQVPEKDEDWPTIATIVLFRDRVRARLMRLYDDIAMGRRVLTRNIARTLVMTHEHESFHVEVIIFFFLAFYHCC